MSSSSPRLGLIIQSQSSREISSSPGNDSVFGEDEGDQHTGSGSSSSRRRPKKKLLRHGSLAIRDRFLKRRTSAMGGLQQTAQTQKDLLGNPHEPSAAGGENFLASIMPNQQNVDWWKESEFVLMRKVQQDVFAAKEQDVVFLAKMKKPKKGAKDKDQCKNQLLIICKLKDDLILHIMTLKGWSIRSSTSLQTLRLIDGNAEIPFTTAFDDSKLKIKLEFHHRTSKTRYFCIFQSLREKSIVCYIIIELCKNFFNHEPAMQNLNITELRLAATNGEFSQRCKLLSGTRKSGSAYESASSVTTNSKRISRRKSSTSTLGSARSVSEDDDSDFDLDESAKSGSRKSFFGGKENGKKNEPGGASELLNEDEQKELWDILQGEGLVGSTTAGKLSQLLKERIEELEEETGDVLRQWENRGDSSDYIAAKGRKTNSKDREDVIFDPIAGLVQQLEDVHIELTDMDAWMSHYNMELRTMRKDIHKIEHENNRLQIQSANRENLRVHLRRLFQHYAISADSQVVLQNLEQILNVDTVQQVENNVAPPNGEAEALERLSKLANELHLALKGKAVQNRPGEQFPEEPYMLSVRESVEKLRNQTERFCGYVHFFISWRIREHAEEFRRTKASLTVSQLDLPTIVRRNTMHRTFGPYARLIEALQILEVDGFQKVVAIYVKDMGEACGDVVQSLFTVLKEETIPGTNTTNCVLMDMVDAKPEHHEAERNLAIAKAHQLSGNSTLVCGEAFGHCLVQLVPMIVEEERFLSQVFWQIEEVDATKLSELELKTLEQKRAQVQETMKSIFLGKCKILQLLNDQIKLAGTNVFQLIIMLVHLESLNLEFGPKSPFCNYIFVDETQGLRKSLQESFERFVDEQIRWAETYKVDSKLRVLPGIMKLPILLDQIVALWNVLTNSVHALCSRKTYDAQSTMFSRNVIGRGLQKLVRRLFNCVEQVASGSQKVRVGELIRLENYHFLIETLSYRGGSSLGEFVAQSGAKFKEALERYIGTLLRVMFSPLLEFVDEIETLLEQTTPAEIPYHKNRGELAQTMQRMSFVYIQQNILSVKKQVEEQLRGNQVMLNVVFARLRDATLTKYKRYVYLIEECYGDVVSPTMDQVKQLVATFSNQQAN